jgi:ribulose-5-phosphate 4-epimerase/fuculose-1-phosphate aldolase
MFEQRAMKYPMRTTEDLKRCGRVLDEKGLVWGRSGNISVRVESNTFMISASGVDLGNLCEDDFVICHLHDNTSKGVKPPSIERGLHQAIYKVHQDAGGVIHSQPFYTTLVACSSMAVEADLFPEAMAYLERIERVPYYHAGSDDLAQATADRASASYVLLLENHGAVCWGSDIDEALLRTQTLEFLCRLLVLSNASSITMSHLGEETMLSFLDHLNVIGRA